MTFNSESKPELHFTLHRHMYTNHNVQRSIREDVILYILMSVYIKSPWLWQKQNMAFIIIKTVTTQQVQNEKTV